MGQHGQYRALVGGAAALLALAGPSDAACRQALVLGLDISGSVNAREYRLQLDGLADALDRAKVRAALFALPGAPVDLSVFAWSGPSDAAILQRWTTLTTPADLARVTARLRGTGRPATESSTAIGSAMLHGQRMLDQRPACWRSVLDLSGDGKSNTGPRPRDARNALPADMTVNALVIGADPRNSGDRRQAQIGELAAYFESEVIHGPGAFVETAVGFEDFADAMARKLIREMQVRAIGALPPGATLARRPHQ